MRFETSNKPPLGPSWRMILFAVTLAPSLLILTWSLRQARQPKLDPMLAGRTPDEARRLKRLLNEANETSPLGDDAVRLIADVGEVRTTTPLSGVRIDKSLLAPVADNTFGVTAAEKPAYDMILDKLRAGSLAEFEQIAHQDVPFAVLMLEADRYRGEVLTVQGEIRRVNKLAGTAVSETWEAWLFTTDSGLNPYRVVITSLPEDVRLDDDLKPPVSVRVSGYFFKRYSYATANDYHTAPLLLAKTLTRLARSKAAVPQPVERGRWLTFVAVGTLAAFLVIGLAIEVISRHRTRQRRRLSEEIFASPPDFSMLDRD